MPPEPVRVFLVSSQTMRIEAMKKLVRDAPEFALEISGTAASKKELMAALEGLRADVLLLDRSLPDAKGMDLITEVRKINPFLKIVLLISHEGMSFSLKALDKGAKGVIIENGDIKAVAGILRAIHNQGIVIYQNDDDDISICEQLTSLLDEREMKIICLIAAGKNGKDICKEMHLTEDNLGRIKKQMYEKVKDLKEFSGLNGSGIGYRLTYYVGVCDFDKFNNNL